MPHSDISGSVLTSSSPERFVGRHVLHRLCVPRYPPLALCSLTLLHSLDCLEEIFDVFDCSKSSRIPAIFCCYAVFKVHTGYSPAFSTFSAVGGAEELFLARSIILTQVFKFALENLETFFGGGKRTRTADICLAKAALYQLSYTPSFWG